METEKKCGIDTESSATSESDSLEFSTSFLTRLSQLQIDDDDEEAVDNTQD